MSTPIERLEALYVKLGGISMDQQQDWGGSLDSYTRERSLAQLELLRELHRRHMETLGGQVSNIESMARRVGLVGERE